MSLPENTTYGSPQPSLPSSAISKLEASIKKSNLPTAPSGLTKLKQMDFSGFGARPVSDQVNAPLVNQAYIPYSGTPAPKVSPLAGYSSFKPLVSASDKQFYQTPTDTAQKRNWPEALGGGQYIVDPSIDKNKAVYSSRVLFDSKVNPTARTKILGDLPSNMYEVEHNIPLWAGGTDALENIGIYDIPQHQIKTAVQSVPLTLWRNGVINLDQARAMAFTWKDKDTSGLPTAAEIDANGGLIDLDRAKQISKQWEDDIKKPSLWKGFKASWNESMGNLGKNLVPSAEVSPVGHEVGEFTREAAKGFLGGVTAGIIPGTQQSEDSGIAGWIGHTLGTGAGFVLGLGKFKAGLSLAKQGLKVATMGREGATLFNNLKTVKNATELFSKVENPIINVGADSAKWLANNGIVKRVANNFVDMSLFNQFGLGARELTGQEKFELGNHVTQGITDLKYAALTGIWGQSALGYAGVTGAVTTSALIDGATIEDALKEGVTMAAFHTMGAKGRFKLRGPATMRAEMLPKLASQQEYMRGQTTVRQYLGDQAMEPSYYDRVTPEKVTYDPKYYDALTKKYLAENPNNESVKSLGEIRTQEQICNALDVMAKSELYKTIANSKVEIPQEQIMKEMNRITASTRALYKRTLDPTQRAIEDRKDLESIIKVQADKKKEQSIFSPKRALDAALSTGGNIKDNLQRKLSQNPMAPQIESSLLKPESYKTTQDVLNSIETGKSVTVPNSIRSEYAGVNFIEEGTSATRGATEKVNATVNQNLKDLANARQNNTGQFGQAFIISDAQTKQYIRQIDTIERYTSDKIPTRTPDNALRVFVAELKDGKTIGYRDLGYVTEPRGLVGEQSINKIVIEVGQRFQAKLAKTTSPADVKTMFSQKDKSNWASKTLTDAQATEIFNNKENLLKMDPLVFVDYLKPENMPIKHNLDNSKIAPAMRAHGISALPIEIGKINKETLSGNSYLDYKVNNESFLKALALKQGATAKTTVPESKTDFKQPSTEVISPVEAPIVPKPVEATRPLEKGITEAPIAKTTAPVEQTREITPKEISPKKETIETPAETFVSKEGGTEKTGVQPYEFFENPGGVNKGISKIFDDFIATLPEGDPRIRGLENVKESVGPKFFDKTAEIVLKKAGGDKVMAAESFINHIRQELTKRGLPDPIPDYPTHQAFVKIFRDSIENKPMQTMIIDANGNSNIGVDTSKHPLSPLERILEKKLGVKDFVYMEDNIKNIEGESTEPIYQQDGAETPLVKKNPRLTKEAVVDNFIKNDYVPFFYDNSVSSAFGIKFDPKLANGGKVTDPVARGEFAKNIFKALGYKPGRDSYNSIAKRMKSLNSHQKQSPIVGETQTIYVIKDSSGFNKTVRDTTPNYKEIKINPVVPDAEAVKDGVLNKLSQDGDTFTSPANLARIGKDSGFAENPQYMKDTVTHQDADGNLWHMKHETRAWTPELKARFEEQLGRTLRDTDHVTIEGNVKEGLKTPIAKDMGNYWEAQIPSEAWSLKFQNPHTEGASLSPGSIISKATNITSPEIISKISEPYRAHAEVIKDIIKEFKNFDGTKSIESLWKSHPELKKNNYLNGLYGDLQLSAKHGAGPIEMGKSLNTTLNNIIKDQYFRAKFLKGDTLHIMTDLGQKIDPKTGKKVYLNSGEMMIPRDSFIDSHGKEAYKKLRDGEDFYVFAYRYPVLKPTSVKKMKVLIAEDHGLPNGRSQVVLNSADKFGVFDADTDGDTVQYKKIGGKDGVPKELVDHFDAETNKGEMYFKQLTSTDKKIFKETDNAYDEYMKFTDKNLIGGEAVGIAAASTRAVRELILHNMRIVVGPSRNGERTVTTYFNGKPGSTRVVKEFTKTKDGSLIDNFKGSPKNLFTIEPRFGDKEAYELGFMGQAAVDINGKSDLPNILKPYGGNPSAYVNDVLFTNNKSRGTNSIVFDETKDFNIPYRLDKAEGSVMDQLAPYNRRMKKLKEAGGPTSLTAEITGALEGIEPIDYFSKSTPEDRTSLRTADDLGVKKVEEKFSDYIGKLNEFTPKNLTAWENVWNQVKRTNNGIKAVKEAGETAWKEFKKERGITAADKKAIAIWATTSDAANLAKTGDAIMHRPKFLLNADPEVAKAYFEGQNSYKRGVSEEKKWAPSDAEGGPTPGTGSWGMIKEKISKPNGQGGPYTAGAGVGSYVKNFLMGPFGGRSVEVNFPKAPKKVLHPLDMERFLDAIKANETSIVRGDVARSSQFSGVPKLGRAMGDYRVTEGELASYAPRYIGRKVTPQEFQNSAEIQREYMKGKANWFNKEGYTPQETADIHNKGMTNSFPAGSGKYQNPDYVNKFNVNYNAPSPKITLTQ